MQLLLDKTHQPIFVGRDEVGANDDLPIETRLGLLRLFPFTGQNCCDEICIRLLQRADAAPVRILVGAADRKDAIRRV